MPYSALSSMAPTGHNERLSFNRAAIAPSPTLTNPDMILPYGGERETSTPSPPFEALQRAAEHSRLLASSFSPMRQRSTSTSTTTSFDRSSLGYDETRNNYADNIKDGSPQLLNSGLGDGFTRPQLSEVENTLRSHARWPNSRNTKSMDNLGNPGLGLTSNDGLSKRHSKLKELQDLPDDFFEQEKSHLEDDKGTLTNSADIGAVIFEPEHRILPMGAIAEEDEEIEEKLEMPEKEGDDDDDIEELTSMLENAKLRLTHMEGNLNRARTSFRMTPSPSPSLNRSFGGPGGSHKLLARGERRSQTSLAGALLRQRAHQVGNMASHVRGQSDLYSPSSRTHNRLSVTNGQFRSYSAMGSTSVSEYGNEFYSPEEERYRVKQSELETESSIQGIDPDRSRSMTPSSSQVPSISQRESQTSPLGNEDTRVSPKISRSPPLVNQPTPASQPTTPPSRPNSQLSMLDLQGQVDGLRSKLSNLKERTQEESVRRRSHQSLRTPSPFTVADQSYTNPLEYQRKSSYPDTLTTPNYDKPLPTALQDNELLDEPTQVSPPKSTKGKNANVAQDAEDKMKLPTKEAVQEFIPDRIDGSVKEIGVDPVEKIVEEPSKATDNGISEYFDYADDISESEDMDIDRQALAEILEEPLDSPVETLDQGILEEFPAVPVVQETIRHEDRIDAFDYEHFILHSALGTYSGGSTRPRSFGSVGSVETTRPSSQRDGRRTPKNKPSLLRVMSNDSISTEATFATATEGENGYDEVTSPIGHDTYWDQGRITPRNKSSRHHAEDSLTIPQFQEYDESSMYSNTQSVSSTPRASVSRESATHEQNAALLASVLELQKAAATPPTPGLLVKSIISSAVNENSKSESGMYPPHGGILIDSDAELVEAVIQSLGNVSLELLRASTTNLQSAIDNRIVTILRRRLDAARRILDGLAPLETSP